ncbi:flagellin [Enterovirga aerilata]|uniref:Flagellin n=1 Tax=Enterovirga aerilata TaxID=2730920 RepID=A0A849IL67_9HYPH|nr:flagellin [Enterovirga sp. DB1703]NNM74693.1 flagellar biosynthesis protein FlgL [Enterovirga sp. DB1703]
MTIRAYGTAAFSSLRSTQSFETAKANLAALQNQLASGKASTTYSGLGIGGASATLALRTRMTTLDGYAASIADGQLRLRTMETGLEQIAKLASGLTTSLAASASETPVGATNVAVSAQSGFQTIVDILNTNLAGRHLFSGRAADTEPVASASLMLDGDGTRAGLRTLIAERRAADFGGSGLGRLTLATAGTTVTLAEEAAGLPFGIKLASAEPAAGNVTATLGAGPPPAVAVSVAAQPAVGDTVSIGVTLPDGTAKTITLVAGGSTATGTTAFAIGATTADTAANIQVALNTALTGIAAAELPASSAMKAANDFFAATSGSPPPRVAGPPFDTATAQVAGTAADTVIWYAGDSSASPRDTAPVRIGDARTVGIGAQANEPAFQAVLASFAALAADSFPASDATALKRYQALGAAISARLNIPGAQKVADIAAELSVAGATMGEAAGDLKITRAQAEDALAEIENADPTEAAMKLLATQTRLQASYQATSVLQRLSLVNYL